MTLDEVIEVSKIVEKELKYEHFPSLPREKYLQAQKIIIEALEYIRDYCEDSPLLPSETKEGRKGRSKTSKRK